MFHRIGEAFTREHCQRTAVDEIITGGIGLFFICAIVALAFWGLYRYDKRKERRK